MTEPFVPHRRRERPLRFDDFKEAAFGNGTRNVRRRAEGEKRDRRTVVRDAEWISRQEEGRRDRVGCNFGVANERELHTHCRNI